MSSGAALPAACAQMDVTATATAAATATATATALVSCAVFSYVEPVRSAVAGSLVLVLAACSSAPTPPPPAPPTDSAAAPSAAPSAPSATPSAAPSAPPPPPSIHVVLQREVEAAVTALALEAPPHAAALGQEAAFIHDAQGWKTTKLPASVAKDRPPRLQIFYGRDNRVRVVGTRTTAAGAASIYLRWKPAGFLSGASEIGRLGSGEGAMVAVLGTRDPEIVCRPAAICIIKRRTGWTVMPAPADIERVTLGDDVGWGVGGQALYRLGDGLRPVGEAGTWKQADDLFALRDRAWVIETEAGRLHAFDGTSWQVTPSPIPRPRAMWGASASALWLVGDGIAFFDGAVWRVDPEAQGPFMAVLGRSAEDVWIGGEGGVFRVMTEAAP